MNKTGLLKKLLPGFIPLFVFIAADEIWGTKIGLFVAVGVGVAELAWVGYKEKRFDKFILFDTLLLVVLGAVSIVLDNDIFFQIETRVNRTHFGSRFRGFGIFVIEYCWFYEPALF